jgi:hypothetical protein
MVEIRRLNPNHLNDLEAEHREHGLAFEFLVQLHRARPVCPPGTPSHFSQAS